MVFVEWSLVSVFCVAYTGHQPHTFAFIVRHFSGPLSAEDQQEIIRRRQRRARLIAERAAIAEKQAKEQAARRKQEQEMGFEVSQDIAQRVCTVELFVWRKMPSTSFR